MRQLILICLVVAILSVAIYWVDSVAGYIICTILVFAIFVYFDKYAKKQIKLTGPKLNLSTDHMLYLKWIVGILGCVGILFAVWIFWVQPLWEAEEANETAEQSAPSATEKTSGSSNFLTYGQHFLKKGVLYKWSNFEPTWIDPVKPGTITVVCQGADRDNQSSKWTRISTRDITGKVTSQIIDNYYNGKGGTYTFTLLTEDAEVLYTNTEN